MGAGRLLASRRLGTRDGIASSCIDARAACASALPHAFPLNTKAVAGGVHPGVARGLTFSVDLRQDRAPSLADTAELRPCHPEKVA